MSIAGVTLPVRERNARLPRAVPIGGTSMDMEGHLLAALREQFARWDQLLARLSDAAIVAPRFAGDWSIKDVMVHLWVWQQISVARMAAAATDSDLALPAWIGALGDDWVEDAD